jgi:hypothetical protein
VSGVDGATGEVVEAVTLDPRIAQQLAEIGIDSPSQTDPLHVRLVDALWRTMALSEGERLTAIQWVFNWDLGRQGVEFAESKTAYETELAKAVVRFRDDGEKSGEMCIKRAEATDEIRAAALRFRLAEQLERLARKRLETVRNQIEVWRSQNATRRAADSFHGSRGV